MTTNEPVVAVYQTHSEAEEAVQELQRRRFDMRKLSIIDKSVVVVHGTAEEASRAKQILAEAASA